MLKETIQRLDKAIAGATDEQLLVLSKILSNRIESIQLDLELRKVDGKIIYPAMESMASQSSAEPERDEDGH